MKKISTYDVNKLLKKKLLDKVLSKYFLNLSGLKLVNKKVKISDFSANVTFELERRLFFLKIFLTPQNNFKFINYGNKIEVLNIYNKLSKFINISKIIKTLNRKDYVIIDNNMFVLYEFIRGSNLTSFDDDNIVKFVKQLSMMHKFKINNKYESRLDGFSEFSNELARFFEICPEYKKSIGQIKINNSHKGLCHFDLNPSNIYLAENNKIFLFDFELLNYNYIILDLANLVCKFIEFNVDYRIIGNILKKYFKMNRNMKNDARNLKEFSFLMCCYIFYRRYKYDIKLLRLNLKNLRLILIKIINLFTKLNVNY